MAGHCSIGWGSSIKTCPQFCFWSPSQIHPLYPNVISSSGLSLDVTSGVCWSRLAPARPRPQECMGISIPNSSVTSRGELEISCHESLYTTEMGKSSVFSPWSLLLNIYQHAFV